MSEQHPQVQEAMELIRAKATLHPSKEEAWAAAESKAASLNSEQRELFDNIIHTQIGCKPVSFYLPESLIQALSELEQQGIDPHDLVETAVSAAVKTAQSVLTQRANLRGVPLIREEPSEAPEITDL